ncbi:MAG TPA: TonB family protein [Casimicrobiaceae bacterium]
MGKAPAADGVIVIPARADRASGTTRLVGLVFVVALHGLGLILLWQYAPAREALGAAAPIFVELLKPLPPVETKPREPPKPIVKPRPQPTPASQPTPVAPIIAAPEPMRSEIVVPPPPPPSPPQLDVAGPKSDAAPPAPMSPARFDAEYLRNPPPPYPPISRRNGEHGRVLLRVRVAANGDAQDVEIKTSSGSDRLDRSAQDTVRRWKFVPARVGSAAVDAWVLVPIIFSLER